MREYKIIINSNSRAIICSILLMPLFLFSVISLPNYNSFIQYLTILILFLAFFMICDLVSRGTVRIFVDSTGFKVVWTRQFLFSKYPNIDLGWDRIIDFNHFEDRGLERFKLTLTNNQQYVFYKYTLLPPNDDFAKFMEEFPTLINQTNEELNLEINEGQSEYLSNSFQWALVILTIAGTFLLVNKLIDPSFPTRWSALGLIFFGIIYYWLNVLYEKRK